MQSLTRRVRSSGRSVKRASRRCPALRRSDLIPGKLCLRAVKGWGSDQGTTGLRSRLDERPAAGQPTPDPAGPQADRPGMRPPQDARTDAAACVRPVLAASALQRRRRPNRRPTEGPRLPAVAQRIIGDMRQPGPKGDRPAHPAHRLVPARPRTADRMAPHAMRPDARAHRQDRPITRGRRGPSRQRLPDRRTIVAGRKMQPVHPSSGKFRRQPLRPLRRQLLPRRHRQRL